MTFRGTKPISCLSLTVAALVPAVALVAPAASAEPRALDIRVTTVPSGTSEGAVLAVDQGRRALFIADGDDYFQKEDITGQVAPYPHTLRPKVAVLNVDSRRVVRTIDYAGLPSRPYKLGPLTLPHPHVPVGLAIDPVRGRVVTSSARHGSAAIMDMGARRARVSDLVRTSTPLNHVMGVAADSKSGRAYLANSYADIVAVIDTATRREIAAIRGIYRPSMMAVDPNADITTKTKNNVTVVDTATHKVLATIPTKNNSRPAVDPVTGRVYAASYNTGEIAVIDPVSLKIVKRIDTRTSPNMVALGAQRRLAYTANLFKRSITVIDLDTERVLRTVKIHERPHSVAVDPRTGRVFASSFQSPALTVLSVTARQRGNR